MQRPSLSGRQCESAMSAQCVANALGGTIDGVVHVTSASADLQAAAVINGDDDYA